MVKYYMKIIGKSNSIVGHTLIEEITIVVNKIWKQTPSQFQTGETFKMFHQLNVQCRFCQLQYVGKCKTSFDIRLNNHRKDSKNKNPILSCKHFQNSNHNFQRDAKFTLIKQIAKNLYNYRKLRLLLKKRENFWILKLKTLNTDGLNQECNSI